ncbi:MAG: serine/threonine-protein kinase [Verrucomicrobiota bacterium]
MPESPENLATCQSCGGLMNVEKLPPFANVACPTCGEHNRVKCQFGPYTLVRRHAIGGMSMVFIAHDPTLDREVALKILSEEFSADERRIAAFEEEARITASFSHPHVVRVLTTGKAFGRLYIAMELVPGGHFERRIHEAGKVPEVEMLPLAIEVAEGLKAAHAAGLIHRDIKPGNILLDAEGHARIVDFGLSLVTQGGKAQAAEIWATPYYVPPETIEGHPEDFRSDIYAFGATLYHALAGVPSCDEESMGTQALRLAKTRVVSLGVTDPTLSEGICAIVDKAMAYSPDDRYSSYDEMIRALSSALKRLHAGTEGESSGKAAHRRAMRKRTERISLASAAVILLGGVGAGIWWVTRDQPQPVAKATPVRVAPVVETSPVESGTSASEIARSYREARAAVEAGEFTKAAVEFEKLRENPSVQEPTRSWAGVEAVVADFLDGQTSRARERATEAITHARAVVGDDTSKLDEVLITTLERTGELPAISPEKLVEQSATAPQVMAWMLAGLKNWEQGMLKWALPFFKAVADSELPPDDAGLSIYQKLARDYLADGEILSAPVFEKFPVDVAGCDAAVSELDEVIGKLRTKGRARFNVRAWQLDLKRHAKLLAAAPPEPPPVQVPVLDEVMAKLAQFAASCEFDEATAYVKSLETDPQGASRESLEWATLAAATFLTDLRADLAKQTKSGEFPLKSGETARRIMLDPSGLITTTDADGAVRDVGWSDFTADALIALHRSFVASPVSESERVRRHECAIAFDWLAGNRERALTAAATLSQGNSDFRKRWETVSAGLPQ